MTVSKPTNNGLPATKAQETQGPVPQTILWNSGNRVQATRVSSIVLVIAKTECVDDAEDAPWSWCSLRGMHKHSAYSLIKKSGESVKMSTAMKAVVRDNLTTLTPWMRFGGKWVRLNLAVVQVLHVPMTQDTTFQVACDLEGRTRQWFRVCDMSCTEFIQACLGASSGGRPNFVGPYSHDGFTEHRYEKWSVLISAPCIETVSCIEEDVVIPGSVFRMNFWMNNGRALDGVVVTYAGPGPIQAARLVRHLLLDAPGDKDTPTSLPGQAENKGCAEDVVLRWESRTTRKASERRARNAARRAAAAPY